MTTVLIFDGPGNKTDVRHTHDVSVLTRHAMRSIAL